MICLKFKKIRSKYLCYYFGFFKNNSYLINGYGIILSQILDILLSVKKGKKQSVKSSYRIIR
jgi:hypothetical protein